MQMVLSYLENLGYNVARYWYHQTYNTLSKQEVTHARGDMVGIDVLKDRNKLRGSRKVDALVK